MVRVFPFIGSRKSFTITFRTPQETLLSTPETLPTTEPGTSQISYTVAEAGLPTVEPKPYSHKYIAVVYGAGKFTTAGTLYWRMRKNNTSVANGNTSIAANTFYTVNAFFLDVAVDDVLELRLWSSVSDSNWDYKAFFVYVTRFQPFNLLNRKVTLYNVRLYNENATYPTLTLGNPTKWIPNYPFELADERRSTYWGIFWISGETTMTRWPPHDTYGLWRIFYYGDADSANTVKIQTDATYRPKYYSNYIRMFTICRALRIE